MVFFFSHEALGQEIYEFNYAGTQESLELPAGKYKLEVWGAQGGYAYPDAPGGKGGYSVGSVEFTEAQTIQIFVGESGAPYGDGSFNGGGMAGANYGAEGGGATDIRVSPYGLNDRIIVAGGGGGATFGSFPLAGGQGGGLSGEAGQSGYSFNAGQGGTQNSGGAAGCCYETTANGSFGQGAGTGSYHNAGGGGGWYGGGSGAGHAGAGGGSGYVGSLLESEIIAGNGSMPDPYTPGETISGKQGNGYARITQLYEIIALEINNATCSNTEDGSIQILVSGGTPPYSFAWSNGVLNTSENNTHEISALPPGSYTITVTDADGNETTATYNLGPDPLELSVEITEASSCNENSDGTATALVSGGTTPYNLAWNTGEETQSISNLAVGSYSVTVSDANECTTLEESVIVSSFDDEAPVAFAQNIDIYLDATGSVTITGEDVNNGSTDNCGIFNMTLSQTEFTCEDLNGDPTQINFTVTDYSGNSSEADAFVTVLDTVSPKASARDLIVELNQSGFAEISINEVDNGSSDNCSIAAMEINQTNFSCEDLGQNDLTLTVVDQAGNEDQTSFTVYVMDDLEPMAPDTIFSELYLNEDGLTYFNSESILAQASDNCGLNAIVAVSEGGYQNIDGLDFSCSDAGEVQGMLYVQDYSENVTDFVINLDIIDTIKPALNLDFIEIEIAGDGYATISEDALLPYASDNCGISELLIEHEPLSCDLIGQLQSATITLTDIHGNVQEKTIDVSITDNLAPEISVQNVELALDGEGTAVLDISEIEISIAENCSVGEILLAEKNYSCLNLGVNTNSVTAYDIYGNSSTVEFNVTVVDNKAPIINGPDSMILCAGEPINYEEFSAIDNCFANLHVVDGPANGEIVEQGNYMVELQAEDAGSNIKSHYLSLRVLPQPRVNLGPDIKVAEGDVVTLTAGFDPEYSYSWSTGQTTPSITFTAVEDMLVSVDVSSPEGCMTSDDIFINVIEPLDVSENEILGSAILYPNPTNGLLNASFNLSQDIGRLNVTIHDISGKMVQQAQFIELMDGQVIALDLTNLSDGVYLLKMESETLNQTHRIVKN